MHIIYNTEITLIFEDEAVQTTGYVRATFHPTIDLCPACIFSAERSPPSWAVYPLRRN
jgi:hypothetical protein